MTHSILLDWLRFTVAKPFLNELFVSRFGLMVEECAAQGFYNTALRLHSAKGPCGRIDWHTEHPEQKVCYTFTGKDLDLWREREKVESLLAWAVSQRANFTRADIAIDIKEEPAAKISELTVLMDTQGVKTTSKTWSVIEGKRDGIAGTTLYIGARQSEKFCRVYDKAAEQGIKGDWVRIELECKGDYAKRMIPMLLDNGMDFGRAELLEFVNFPVVPWWVEATKGGQYERPKVDRTPGDRRKWQNDVLLGMFADAMEENEEFRAAALVIVANYKL